MLNSVLFFKSVLVLFLMLWSGSTSWSVILWHVTVTSSGWHGDASGESELSRLSSCAY